MTINAADAAVRTRDAGNTRQLLLHAARRHFARDGYTTATVRDIATEAGVNVALINRYFHSKEGLFEACIIDAAEDFKHPDFLGMPLDRILLAIIRSLATDPEGDTALKLLLLLRTSGDEQADAIRRKTLESFSQRIAVTAGILPDSPDFTRTVLHAEIALAATIGIAVLRSSTGVEPLTSASEDDLAEPMAKLLAILLPG